MVPWKLYSSGSSRGSQQLKMKVLSFSKKKKNLNIILSNFFSYLKTWVSSSHKKEVTNAKVQCLPTLMLSQGIHTGLLHRTRISDNCPFRKSHVHLNPAHTDSCLEHSSRRDGHCHCHLLHAQRSSQTHDKCVCFADVETPVYPSEPDFRLALSM